MKKLKILFVCTGNSCRSQMAEGWARHLKGDAIEPYSAGVNPKNLDLRAVRVMKEAGMDISNHQSKHVRAMMNIDFDYVVTVCDDARESCPVFPGRAKIFHHSFEDPPWLARRAKTEEEALSQYRRIRDEIKKFVQTLPEGLRNQRERDRYER